MMETLSDDERVQKLEALGLRTARFLATVDSQHFHERHLVGMMSLVSTGLMNIDDVPGLADPDY